MKAGNELTNQRFKGLTFSRFGKFLELTDCRKFALRIKFSKFFNFDMQLSTSVTCSN